MENPEIPSSTMVDEDYRPEYLEDEDDLIAIERRRGRKLESSEFRSEYSYGRCKDEKICIWPSGEWWWFAESSGITWVGVHGADSICVVTKAGDLDLSRVHGLLQFQTKEDTFRDLRRTVVSEMEDLATLADTDSYEYQDPFGSFKPLETPLNLLKAFSEGIKKPFGVVSMVPLTDKVAQAKRYEYEEIKSTRFIMQGLYGAKKSIEQTSIDYESESDEDNEDAILKDFLVETIRDWRTILADPEFEKTTIKFVHEEMIRQAAIKNNETVEDSSDKYDDKTAIEFLKKGISREQDFTLERTMQIAISAFQLLFGRNFNAEEIEVCLMDPEYFVTAEEAIYKDVYVNHLERGEIEKVLVDMRLGSSSGDPGSD